MVMAPDFRLRIEAAMTTDQLLEIEFPMMRYDITMPILEGRVAIDGVQLRPVKSSSMIDRGDL